MQGKSRIFGTRDTASNWKCECEERSTKFQGRRMANAVQNSQQQTMQGLKSGARTKTWIQITKLPDACYTVKPLRDNNIHSE